MIDIKIVDDDTEKLIDKIFEWSTPCDMGYHAALNWARNRKMNLLSFEPTYGDAHIARVSKTKKNSTHKLKTIIKIGDTILTAETYFDDENKILEFEKKVEDAVQSGEFILAFRCLSLNPEGNYAE